MNNLQDGVNNITINLIDRDINLRYTENHNGRRYLVASKARIAKTYLNGGFNNQTRGEIADTLKIGLSTLSLIVRKYNKGDYKYDNCITVNEKQEVIDTTYTALQLAEQKLEEIRTKHLKEISGYEKTVHIETLKEMAVEFDINMKITA